MNGQPSPRTLCAVLRVTDLGSIEKAPAQRPHVLDISCRQLAGAANLSPPKLRQRQPTGTGSPEPRASTTESGERVSVASIRLASGPRAVTITLNVGA